MITRNGLEKISVDINAKYTAKIVVEQYYDGEYVGKTKLSCNLKSGDSIAIDINGINVIYDGETIVYKKWWEFWK